MLGLLLGLPIAVLRPAAPPATPSTSQVLIEGGVDALLIEGGADALMLEA